MDKKILIIANDFTTVYNFRIELINHLVSVGKKVFVALPRDDRNSLLEDAGATVIDLKVSRFGTNPVEDLKTTCSIIKIIKQIKPHIVFTYTAKPNIYGGLACRLTSTPYVVNITGLGSNFEKQNLVSKIMLFLQKIAYKKAKKIFFQNKSNLDFFIKKKVIKSNYEVLPGSGVNLITNPYEKYPNNDTVKFITIARVRKDKGYDELFYAIEQAQQNKLNAQFHIVGWYEDDLYKSKVEAFENNDNVIFYDGVPHEEIHSLISACDCLIHPSHHEGMSNVVLEAAATGRPAIVSNISGCIEGVNDKETGFHFIVKSQEDLYDKISTFVALPKEQKEEFGKKAHQKAVKEFDRQIVIDKYCDLI